MQKKVDRKRFVRCKEGAELYFMCQSKFEEMAKDAGVIYTEPYTDFATGQMIVSIAEPFIMDGE